MRPHMRRRVGRFARPRAVIASPRANCVLTCTASSDIITAITLILHKHRGTTCDLQNNNNNSQKKKKTPCEKLSPQMEGGAVLSMPSCSSSRQGALRAAPSLCVL